MQIDTTTPTVSSVAASGSGITSGNGNLNAGDVVTLTVNLSSAVTVAGGTPTLTLNDGGTATYTGGSGTNALIFSYTVAAGQNTSDLAVTAVNLNAATVKDSAGNAANLAGAVTNPSGTLQIDTTTPTVSSVASSGTGITSGNGILNAGDVVTLIVNLSEAVTVAGGTPTLALNNGGTATYTGGSGTSALTFSYTVAAGQNTSDLAVTALNLNAATVKDSAGNTANLAGAVTNPSGTLQIDTTAPTVSSVAASGTGITSGNGIIGVGSVVTLTVNLSEAVTVAGGTPTLTLNDGGTATYAGGSGTNALTFSYTVAAGQNTSDLAVTAVNLNAATVKDSAGNAANLAGAVTNPSGTLQINTAAPTGSSPAITLESVGSTSLVLIDKNYYLNSISTDSGLVLTYLGSKVVAGAAAPWTPIAAEQTATGYDVAWKDSKGNFSIWTTDSNGKFTSYLTGVVSGTSTALEALEATFHQDLNGDGTIGVVQSVIEAIGTTALVASGDNYLLNPVAGGTGPTLKYHGAAVTTGQFGDYTPLGVEAVSNGYEVAWKNTSTGQYSVWSTDANGNYTGNFYMPGPGNSTAFETLETSFHQDLNGDGTIGVVQSVIEAIGTTALVASGDNYLLNPVAGGTGPTLKYQGATVTAGQFGDYTPIGVEAVSNGYEVAWKNTTTGQYSVWSTDANGNYTGNFYMPGRGNDAAFGALEASFHQDLNGDGIIVLSGTGTTVSKNSLVIGNGASVEITGAYSGSIRFAGATGTLIIDDSSTFTGSFRGQLAIGDIIDLTDIAGGANASLTYSGNGSPGTLTVTDGTHTANLAMLGNYSLGNFIASSDGNGGTSIADPPLPGQSADSPSNEAEESSSAWMAAVDQRLALWTQHMASAFATPAIDNSLKSAPEFGGSPPNLTMPHQAAQSNQHWG
ncbi:hypothetical protein AYJ54_21350 [Bradyrhizobium centrolobii]|uniref:Tryptophan-rich domain-containing protein n=1 Tax=Bradyrhizobium centrolobii TaxID=1505087 RepID=A0A176YHT7_9BRAD|nr:hypothetical protein AYJ54_21350 [Bradyrhizobium centrolobii]